MIPSTQDLFEAVATAERWRKACDDESLAKSVACQRVAELERELAETRAKLDGANARIAAALVELHDVSRHPQTSVFRAQSALARRGEKP